MKNLPSNAEVCPAMNVLAIGVDDYGEQARSLKLNYADKDARDVAAALLGTQASLYAAIKPMQQLESRPLTVAH